MDKKPVLFTSLSPALLHLYDISNSIVVVIDILRATSTITTALQHGAKEVIPVDSVSRCIEIGKQIEGITAGERDGKKAEGLSNGNSPFEYPESFIKGKTLVLTTTNGTKLLHLALDKGAKEVIIGAFTNLSSVCNYLVSKKKSVMLACAAWKDRINLEDTLFAGAVVSRVKNHFDINCDSSHLAESLYNSGRNDLYEFLRKNDSSHYHRLTDYGLGKDMRYCLTEDAANVLPVYINGRLVVE